MADANNDIIFTPKRENVYGKEIIALEDNQTIVEMLASRDDINFFARWFISNEVMMKTNGNLKEYH